MVNPFFKNHGPFKINDLVESLGLKDSKIKNNLEVLDINDLFNSEKGDITFFHSKKYKDIAQKTKASFCIITENLKNDLNKNCIPIVVRNVLLSTSTITSKFYPESNLSYTCHGQSAVRRGRHQKPILKTAVAATLEDRVLSCIAFCNLFCVTHSLDLAPSSNSAARRCLRKAASAIAGGAVSITGDGVGFANQCALLCVHRTIVGAV